MSEKFDSYERFVFLNKEKENEWKNLDESVKKSVMSNLRLYTDKMESKISIELLANVINDMNVRLSKIEDQFFP